MKKTIELPEPAAHMYPSDLEKFKSAETFAQAYSVAVGNPNERSVPLFTLSDMVAYANAETEHLRERTAKSLAMLNTARCTTNQEALFDLIVQATGPLTPNALGQGSAACGASPAPQGCASNGDTE